MEEAISISLFKAEKCRSMDRCIWKWIFFSSQFRHRTNTRIMGRAPVTMVIAIGALMINRGLFSEFGVVPSRDIMLLIS